MEEWKTRMSAGKGWTQKEVDYLEDSWGVVTLETIARNLGRTKNAIKLKAYRMGLGDPLLHFDGISINQLSKVIKIQYGILMNWIKRYDFPAEQKRFVNNHYWVITYEDFWNWAKENKNMIDFTRFDRFALGIEPDWVSKQRRIDFIRKEHAPKPHNTPWSAGDDNRRMLQNEQKRSKKGIGTNSHSKDC